MLRFNEHVLVDFLFFIEFGDNAILQMIDIHTAFSITYLMTIREMSSSAKKIELKWINVHGAPKNVSAYLEFFKKQFADAPRYFSIIVEPCPARLHNKLWVVESKNLFICLIAQMLWNDRAYFSEGRGLFSEIDYFLSHATSLSHLLCKSKVLSSFELARDCTPSIASL